MKGLQPLLNCFLLSMLLSGTWVGSLEIGLRWKFNSRQTRKWTSRLRITFWWFEFLEMEYDSWISHKNKKCFYWIIWIVCLVEPIYLGIVHLSHSLLLREHIHPSPAFLANPSFFFFLAFWRNKAWGIQAGPWWRAMGKSMVFTVSSQWRAFKAQMRTDFAFNLITNSSK